ncbi:MAG: ribosomal protein S18-alanine N-acetyltransferase [Clostridia bacterium]|nr:ribosomal protein S18-alanine N-acetyltransferase [Clostridia bacterium]
MIIRKWMLADTERINQIEQASFSDPWSKQTLGEIVDAPNFFGLVIEVEGVVVGYIGASSVLDEGEILLVAVDEKYRGKGLGKTLVNTLLERYASNAIKKVFLEVRRSNAQAISCYQKCGFVKIAERARYYRDGEDAIIMEASL